MSKLVTQLRGLTSQVLTGGGDKANERHTSRGKLLPRERINLLLDKGSPFLELSTLAGHELYGDEVVNSGGKFLWSFHEIAFIYPQFRKPPRYAEAPTDQIAAAFALRLFIAYQCEGESYQLLKLFW